MVLAFSPSSGVLRGVEGPEGPPAKPVHRRATRAKLPESKEAKGFDVPAGGLGRTRAASKQTEPGPSRLAVAAPVPADKEFKSPKMSAKAEGKQRVNTAKPKTKDSYLLSPDAVANFCAAKDFVSPRGQRYIERMLKRNLSRTQIGGAATRTRLARARVAFTL